MTVNVTRLPIQLLPDPRRLWLRGLGCRIEAGRKLIPTDTGHALEWCVVLPKSFQHFSFELVPRLHHSIVFLLPAFSLAGFKAIGSVRDPMRNDSIKQPIVESSAAR